MPTRTLTSLPLLAAICLPTLAATQQQPRPDIGALAAGLHISEDQVRNCLPTDPGQGQRPSRSEREAVVNCFKAANPNLTDDDVRSAMQATRP